jgi:hypothetical protein
LPDQKPSNLSGLEERLTELYAAVLQFLACAKLFFEKSSIRTFPRLSWGD